jgi:hypothetical protein
MESQATENLANTESWVTENSVNIENWVTQDSGFKKLEEGKCAAPSKRPAPRWSPRGITKTQKHRLQKMHQRELVEKKEEEERDYWSNRLRPMTKPKQTWWKKRLAKEEGCSNSSEEVSKVTPTRGGDNPESGDGKPESGNCNLESGNYHSGSGNRNPDLGNSNPGKENDRQGEELALGVERAMFEKPENSCAHMKPLLI